MNSGGFKKQKWSLSGIRPSRFMNSGGFKKQKSIRQSIFSTTLMGGFYLMTSCLVQTGNSRFLFCKIPSVIDKWQVRSRYKHISRGWAKSSVLQNCFTISTRMRCAKVSFATWFHEHELTRTEIARVRTVAMHPVRDHLRQCDWDPFTTCLRSGLATGWRLSRTSTLHYQKIRK